MIWLKALELRELYRGSNAQVKAANDQAGVRPLAARGAEGAADSEGAMASA